HVVAIGFVRVQAELAHTARDATLHELALVGPELDAGVFADDMPDEIELGIAQHGIRACLEGRRRGFRDRAHVQRSSSRFAAGQGAGWTTERARSLSS